MSFCQWNRNTEQKMYHDEVWGRPLHDDLKHFEFILFEVLQCGLSWWLVYGKKKIIADCFSNFDYAKIANYTGEDVERIVNTPGMIKSRNKIKAIINNAQMFLKIVQECGSFDKFLWSYSDFKTIIYEKHADGLIPVSNGLSDKISRDLKRRGFKYLGPIVIYSHLQACGIILDHDSSCPCFHEIINNYPCVYKKPYREKGVINYKK